MPTRRDDDNMSDTSHGDTLLVPAERARARRVAQPRKYKPGAPSSVEWTGQEINTMKKQMRSVMAERPRKQLLMDDNLKGWKSSLQDLIGEMDTNPDGFESNLDLLFMWTSWRMISDGAKPQTIDACLNFFRTVTDKLAQRNGFKMQDIEADSYLPHVISIGLGTNKGNFLQKTKDILVSAEQCYPVQNIVVYLFDAMKETRNNRVRQQALTELRRVLQAYGITVIEQAWGTGGPKRVVESIAKQLTTAKQDVRGPALDVLVEIYKVVGPAIRRWYVKSGTKVQSLIDKRLKDIKITGRQPVTASPRPHKVRSVEAREALRKRLEKLTKQGSRPGSQVSFGQTQVINSKENKANNAHREHVPDVFDTTWLSAYQSSSNDPTPQGSPNKRGTERTRPSENGSMGGLLPGRLENKFNSQEFSAPPSFIQNVTSPQNRSVRNGAQETFEETVAGLKKRKFTSLENLSKLFGEGRLTVQKVAPFSDQIIRALGAWLHLLMDPAGYSAADQEDKCVTAETLLDSLFHLSKDKNMLKPLHFETLENYIKLLLTTLISSHLRKAFSNRKKLISTLNDITLQVLQNCDRTSAFFILLKFLKSAQPVPPTAAETSELLKSSPPSKRTSIIMRTANFSNLVVKCLAKLMMLIPRMIKHLKVEIILRVIHEFFSVKPPKVWEGGNDKPFRCVKTCLSKLVESVGEPIRQILQPIVAGCIDPPIIQQLSEQFLRRKFGNGGTDPSAVANGDTSRSSKAVDERLKEIFQNLQMRSTTGKAMEDLHEFLQEHHHVDIEPYLAETSDVFKGYIKRGLNRLKKREEQKKAQEQTRRQVPIPERSPDSKGQLDSLYSSTTSELRKRLAMLKSSPGDAPSEDASSLSNRDSRYDIEAIRARLRKMQSQHTSFTQAANQPAASVAPSHDSSTSQTSLEALRARLAQLKQQSM